MASPKLMTTKLIRYESDNRQTQPTTNMIKSHALLLSAGALALAITDNLTAAPISGSISFNGNVTPFISATGTGTVASDYSLAHSLVFGQTFVSAGADGSFASVPQNSLVNLFSPLQINPPGLPVPASTPLWTTAIGGFSFVLSTLTEDVLTSPFNTLTLRGAGELEDGNPLDDTTGTWVATFTLAGANSGETFSWNSSAKADIPSVSDASGCFVLLGLGMVSLGAFGRMRKEDDKENDIAAS